jgi:hypothetical protein
MIDIFSLLFSNDETAKPAADRANGPQSLAAQCPEANLMLEVLIDAVHLIVDVRQTSAKQIKRAAAEARGWIESEESEDLFSFVSICETLSFDPNWIRKGILARAPAKEPPCVDPPPIDPFPDRRCEHYAGLITHSRRCLGRNSWRCYCCRRCRLACPKIPLDSVSTSA